MANAQLGGGPLLYSTAEISGRCLTWNKPWTHTVSPPPKCLKLMLALLQETELP